MSRVRVLSAKNTSALWVMKAVQFGECGFFVSFDLFLRKS